MDRFEQLVSSDCEAVRAKREHPELVSSVKDRPGLKEFLGKLFKRCPRLRTFLTTDCHGDVGEDFGQISVR
jgi:hypothetical protein